MDRENFHLELLERLTNELRATISKKEEYSRSAYNCILAGLIIRMNVLMEQHLLDFHSEKFESVANLINQTRQKIIHEDDYTNLDNLDDVALEIVNKFDKVCEHEKQFFNRLLKFEVCNHHNVVIPGSKKIIYNEEGKCYEFQTDDVVISVSEDKIIKIKDGNNNKQVLYVVNCDNDMNCFYKEGEEMVYQHLPAPQFLQQFFIRNFNVVNTNYNEYQYLIRELLNRFYKRGNYGFIYVSPKGNINQRKKIAKVLNSYFHKRTIYKNLLSDVELSTIEVPSNNFINYKQVRAVCCGDLKAKMSKRDYFFIHMAISGFSNMNQKLLENKKLPEKQRDLLKAALLVGWTGSLLRNMRREFVESNSEFKSIYDQLVNYRTFFAHNPMQFKSEIYKRALNEYYSLAQGFVSILTSLDMDFLVGKEDKNMIKLISIERPKERFITDCHDQYVELDPTTYVGNRLYYSSKGNDAYYRIGLLNPLESAYYDRKNGEFFAKKFKDEKLRVSRLKYNNVEDVVMDANIEDLLYLFCACKGKIAGLDSLKMGCTSCKKLLLFRPSDKNNNIQHAAYLENLIQDYFSKKYLPYELVQETKVVAINADDGVIQLALADKNGEIIAKVIDKSELEQYNVASDKKRFGHGR